MSIWKHSVTDFDTDWSVDIQFSYFSSKDEQIQNKLPLFPSTKEQYSCSKIILKVIKNLTSKIQAWIKQESWPKAPSSYPRFFFLNVSQLAQNMYMEKVHLRPEYLGKQYLILLRVWLLETSPKI